MYFFAQTVTNEQGAISNHSRTRRLRLKSMWSIETFTVDECVEVTIILGYFQLVLFVDRIRIFFVVHRQGEESKMILTKWLDWSLYRQ